MKHGSKQHIAALQHESNTLAKRLSDAQKRIEALEAALAMMTRHASQVQELHGIDGSAVIAEATEVLGKDPDAYEHPIVIKCRQHGGEVAR